MSFNQKTGIETVLCQDATVDVVRRLQSYFQDENTNLLAIHPIFLPFLLQKIVVDVSISTRGQLGARVKGIIEKVGHWGPGVRNEENLDVEKDAEEALRIQENIVEGLTESETLKTSYNSLRSLLSEQSGHFTALELESHFRDAEQAIANQLNMTIQDLEYISTFQRKYLAWMSSIQDWVN